MKKLISFITAAFSIWQASAQTAFPTRDSISVGNINASVLLHGDMWWDPATQVAKCEFPKNTKKHVGFVSSVWMTGYDGASALHVSAQTYRQDGNDYWPGPLDAAGSLDSVTSAKWAKFWKVRLADLQYFQALTTHTITNTPPDILTWPAAGNIYAAGNGMAPLTIPAGTNMAPFVDLNGNGIYEPLNGEYPEIKGDESLWWTFSDNGPTHNSSHGTPLGVEVHATSYAYNRGTLLDNVVYYEYTLTNKSANTYSNCRMAQFSDADLGYYRDDFIGFDSARRMSIFYNGDGDDGLETGHPINSYGTHIPVQGTTMIVLPGDTGSTKMPVGNFVYYENDNSVIGNPSTYTEYANYMRGMARNGMHFRYNFHGYGIYDTIVGVTSPTSYVYTGDPSDTAQWSECSMVNIPGDRRTVMSSNDFMLAPGATVKIVMALVVTDTNQGGCPNVSFQDVGTVSDTAWFNYFTPPPPGVTGIRPVSYAENMMLYPNPASSKITITLLNGVANDGSFTLTNTLGQKLPVAFIKSTSSIEADVSLLPPGIYYVSYVTTGSAHSMKFVKK